MPSRPPAATTRLIAALTVAVALRGAWVGATGGQPGDEPDPVVTAASLLAGTPLTGEHYAIADAVRTPGVYHVFTITSPFGTFEAEGRSQVAVRLQEIEALARLDGLNKAGVFARSAGESLVKVGAGVVDAVSDPVATAKGIGAGVKRFGVNLGRRTRRQVQKMTTDDPSKPEQDTGSKVGDAAGSAAKSLLGVNSARRRWARRVGADPYTRNPELRAALEDIAKVDAAGSIATRFVVVVPPLIGTTADVGELVWGRDPEEVRKLNEARARALGVANDDANAVFRNPLYTLTMQTRLVAALHAVPVPGAADYLVTAADSDDPREALFFVESAEWLQQEHAATPVTRVLPDSRALVVSHGRREAVALLPLDWIRGSDTTTAEFRELAARARAELGASELRVRVRGGMSDRAAAALAALGWRR
jgi:hypothetical protein